MNATTNTPEITLEQARAVIDAHQEAKNAAWRAEVAGYVGRFFKTKHAPFDVFEVASVPGIPVIGEDERWQYAMVVSVENGYRLSAITFHRRANGQFRVTPFDDIHPQSWTEITAGEFQKAAEKLSAELATLLSPKVRS